MSVSRPIAAGMLASVWLAACQIISGVGDLTFEEQRDGASGSGGIGGSDGGSGGISGSGGTAAASGVGGGGVGATGGGAAGAGGSPIGGGGAAGAPPTCASGNNLSCTSLLFGSSGCTQCVSDNCCVLTQSCLDDSACAGALECVWAKCRGVMNSSELLTCFTKECPGCDLSAADQGILALQCIVTCPQCVCASSDGGAATVTCSIPEVCYLGECKLPNGAACEPTDPSTCASGRCVDYVCCNNDCSAACYSCSLPSSVGTCSPVPQGPDPDLANCNCDGAGHCT